MRVEYNSGTGEFRFHALPPWEDGAPAGRKEKDVVKEAGCRFRKIGADAVWYTDRPDVAAQALKSSQSAGHAVRVDDAAKEALEKAIRARESAAKAAETAAEASRAAASDAAIPAPAGLDYLPFQRAGISYILDRYADGWPGVILGDQMGLGKAQPLDAKVLTPDGWRRMGDIRVGDRVIGSDGRPCSVTGVFPQGEKEVFRVTFSDGSSTECCDEHLWAVNTPDRNFRGAKHRVLELSEIRSSLTFANGNRRHFIPMVKPVEFSAKDLPLHPYILGVLIGNGSIKYRVAFSTQDIDLVARMSDLAPAGVSVHRASTYEYRFCTPHRGVRNPVKKTLVVLGLWGHGSDDKFIPTEYLLGSIEQRVLLLQGLMDTDGYVSKDGTIQYSSNSRRLIDGVVELVQSLGGVARLTHKVSTTEKDHWIATIGLPDEIRPFHVERKASLYRPRTKYKPSRAIASVLGVGTKPCQCISVSADDSLYVTDDHILTHNTIQLVGVVNSLPVEDGPVLVVCPASLKGNLARETLKWGVQGRAVHVWSGKEQPEFADGDVVIVNYDIVHKENVAAALKGGLAKLGRTQWALIACDEAHYLKNPQAKRTQAVLGDSYRKKEGIPALRRLLMTGTPITNKPKELWPLVDACVKKQGTAVFGPGGRDLTAPFTRYWNSYAPDKSFAGLFCGARQGRYGLEDDGASNLDLLQHGLRGSIMVRRTKAEVLKELPPKFRQVVEFAMESDDGVNADQAKAAAKAVKAEAATAGRHEKEIERLRAAVELAKASDDEAAYQSAVAALRSGQGAAFAEMAKVRHETAVAKIPYVVSHIRQALDGQEREADGKRGGIIVFAHHTDVIEAIGEAFGPAARIAHGGTPLKTRQELVDAFQRGDFDVFVCQMQAMGVGHTLTRSSHVVFAELDWVPATVSQAEDRCILAGELVQTIQGLVPIEDIKVGDLVLTHLGNWKPVTATSKRSHRDLITEISYFRYNKPLRSTSDHKLLVFRDGEITWMEAADVRPRDALVMPRPVSDGDMDIEEIRLDDWMRVPRTHHNSWGDKQTNGRAVFLPDALALDDDFLFMCGWYLAEGFVSTDAKKGAFVSFSGHEREHAILDRIALTLGHLGVDSRVYRSKRCKGIELRAFSRELANFMGHHFGRLCEDKNVPTWLMRLPSIKQKHFVQAYTAGDGYLRNGINEWVSKSASAASQVAIMAAKAGERVTLRQVDNRHNAGHWIGSYNDTASNPNRGVPIGTDEYTLNPVREVKTFIARRSPTVTVHDLTVADDHSFVVGFATVHNCHRIGQVSSVLVQHLVLEGSMDATMARRLVEKQAVIDRALDRRADGTLPEMPEEDIEALVADRESEHEPPARAGHTTEATKAVSRERVAEWAEKLADQDVEDIHRALRIVAGACDGAKATDGGGFSKVDAAVGHALSAGESLTARQAALGLTLANRYRRQLPAELKDKVVFLWNEVKGSGGDRKSAGRSALLSAVAEATAGKADGISARTQVDPPRRKSGGHSL